VIVTKLRAAELRKSAQNWEAKTWRVASGEALELRSPARGGGDRSGKSKSEQRGDGEREDEDDHTSSLRTPFLTARAGPNMGLKIHAVSYGLGRIL
jgi:hypothetical protein